MNPLYGPTGIDALERGYSAADTITTLLAADDTGSVNADRIRSNLLTDEMIAQRSKARGVSEADYMGGNLLGLEVTAEDVAQAFVSLAKAAKTTGAVTTVDGGNIAAALR